MPASQKPADPLLGRVLAGRLELVALIGEGVSGRVYRAHHRLLDKAVAVKILHPETREVLADRFKAEARAASRIDHPNSVRIFDFDDDGELLYLTMELLEGETLADRISRCGKLDALEAMRIAIQILGVLGAAHREGIIHRDLKPGNVIIVSEFDEDGDAFDRVKVCDFGLAKSLDAGPELTRENMIVGTPSYMAPEQAAGTRVDARTDLYALGSMLYEMLSGAPPFDGGSITEILIRVLADEPPALTARAPEIDPRLSAIIHRALAKKPEERFDGAAEMTAALRALLTPAELQHPSLPRASSATAAFGARSGEAGPPVAASRSRPALGARSGEAGPPVAASRSRPALGARSGEAGPPVAASRSRRDFGSRSGEADPPVAASRSRRDFGARSGEAGPPVAASRSRRDFASRPVAASRSRRDFGARSGEAGPPVAASRSRPALGARSGEAAHPFDRALILERADPTIEMDTLIDGPAIFPPPLPRRMGFAAVSLAVLLMLLVAELFLTREPPSCEVSKSTAVEFPHPSDRSAPSPAAACASETRRAARRA